MATSSSDLVYTPSDTNSSSTPAHRAHNERTHTCQAVNEHVFTPRQRLAHEFKHWSRESQGRVVVFDMPPVTRDIKPVVLRRPASVSSRTQTSADGLHSREEGARDAWGVESGTVHLDFAGGLVIQRHVVGAVDYIRDLVLL